jgi:hypothetical protein
MPDLWQGEIRDRLDDVFGGRLCVQAWLGYGNVLFLGLSISGEPPLPRPGRRHGYCAYQLRTDLATWSIRAGGRVLALDEPRGVAESAATQLVSHRTTGWERGPAAGALRVDFEHGVSLHVGPFDDADTLEEPAWGVRFPDQMYLEVLCNGFAAIRPYGKLTTDKGTP